MDDRFYTVIMLAHRLYELRRGQIISDNSNQAKLQDYFKSSPVQAKINTLNPFGNNLNKLKGFGWKQ